ncbi:MAG: sialate O-acetylesterase [Lachnospiraceae bacterium]|nr:sialate O-acetylesterase [Lachnospiraceae bacterium]
MRDNQHSYTIKIIKKFFLFVLCTIFIVIIHNESVMAVNMKYPVVKPYIEAVNYPMIRWSEQKGYTYRVYRATSKDGKYKCIAKDIKKNYCKDTDISLKKEYWYKVRVTKKVNGVLRYGEISKPVKISGMLLPLTLNYHSDKTYGYLKWNDYGSPYRYKVLRASSYKGKYKCIADTKKNRYALSKSDSKSRYYYKVVPYKIGLGQKEIEGERSNVAINDKTVDLMIFMGQSNMAGRGDNLKLAPEIEKNTAYEFRAITNPDRLYTMKEPFGKNENLIGGINDVSRGDGIKSGGMVSMLCKTYFEETGVPVVGVSASIGGVRANLFSPGGELFNDAVNRLNKAKRYLNKNGYNIRHIYMVWCQGEADGSGNLSIDKYVNCVKEIIAKMRLLGGIEKCFVVQTGTYELRDYSGVRAAQDKLCKNYKYARMATRAAVKLQEKGMMNAQHYTQEGYNYVGYWAGMGISKYTCSLK